MTTAAEHVRRLARERGLVPAGDDGAAPDQRTAARLLAEDLGLGFVDLATATVPAGVLARVPPDLAHRHGVLPLALRDGRLRVAVADPLAVDVLDGVAALAGMPLEVWVASADELRAALARHHGAARLSGDGGVNPSTAPTTEATPDTTVDGVPVARMVEEVLHAAVRRRASDIHFEPLAGRFRVRFRVDGVLVDVPGPPRTAQAAVISRLKILGNLSIAERRLPQDGRMQLAVGRRTVDLRVATLPTTHGESAVLRILDRPDVGTELGGLGLDEESRAALERLLAAPDGMILVTGPTGSGKTTTLYTALQRLNRTDRKIITVEEPVECQLPGINQVPVNRDTGLTFAAALRAMLRQAPNVVMVGEIRDPETAALAANAALTGHLVLSTLHTRDAAGAIPRLLDLGVPPYLLAATLRAVVAQRLVRRVCADCRREDAPTPAAAGVLGLTAPEGAGAKLARGAGCAACAGTGFRGRVGLFEVLVVDDALRAALAGSGDVAHRRAVARRAVRRPLRQDGVRKVLAGLTTIEELAAVTTGDVA